MGLAIGLTWIKMEKGEYHPIYEAKEGLYHDLGCDLGWWSFRNQSNN
jgi:hypothetical protein